MLYKPENIPEGKKSFVVRIIQHPSGSIEKQIYIDDELLDWSVDIESFHEACRMGPLYEKAAKESIARHFLESVSEVVGRKLTVDDIKNAHINGYI
jgi:hypothetical protein